MKRNNYKVSLKIKYETSMLHSGINAIKVEEEVKKVFSDILKQNDTLKNIFEFPPQIICKARLDDGRR